MNQTETVGALVRARRVARDMALQELADLVGCAKSYLWLIEHERRGSPPPEVFLRKLELALGFPLGRLSEVAGWQRTPPAVRREVGLLRERQRVGQEIARILSGARGEGGRGSLDEAYRSGELQRLVDRIAPPTEPRRDGAVPVGLPREVPVINKVAAGYPRSFTDLGYPARVADEYVRCPDLDDPDAFAARVVGDSMLPEYREGDIVVFSPLRPVKGGADCFVRVEPDHESTFKRVYFEKDGGGGDRIRLQPLNSAYPPRTLAREQVAGLYAAVSVMRKIV
ncbi:MAG: helix-turn-helix domain-containing protein [Phycisphaerales bacterium]|nr:helix-turn-helix domain-containing protein [Phycisphaerales bacterium]